MEAAISSEKASKTNAASGNLRNLEFWLKLSSTATYLSTANACAPGHKFECRTAMAYWLTKPVDLNALHAGILFTSAI